MPTTTKSHEDKVLLLLTLVIGAVVGLVVVAFILLTENLGARLYPVHGAAWRRLVIPTFGALSTGFLLSRYFPNARGSGIPQTKTAIFIRDGFIAFRTVVGKFSLCAVSLASGIALGREGPSVQVGAGIASVLGRKLGLSATSVKALVPAGASAALAAAFNTPIAAVLFALEEVMGDMNAPVLGSIVLSSATSWIVLHLVLGDEPLFHVPPYQLVHPLEFLIYAVLGVVGGFVSVAFVKFLLWLRLRFRALPKSTEWWQPAVGGLTVGILGWFFPRVLGVGYAFVGQALNGELALQAMALLVLLKLIATPACYSSGNAGGIFGPALFIGAMMGGSVGSIAHQWLPDYTASVGAYALVGMGAAFAGIIRTPLTSVIMIFEITRDYSIIVPLMISNLIAYFISSRLQAEPIYEALQHQDGIHLPSGARARETLLTVGQALQPVHHVLAADLSVNDAATSADREAGAWPVVDSAGLRGMLTLAQLEHAVKEGRGDEPLAHLLPPPDHMPHIHADHTLDIAVQRIAETGLNVLPVVSRTNIRELKGVISMPAILAAYAMGSVLSNAPEPAQPARKPVKLLAGALAAMLAIALLGGFLSYYLRSTRTARAQRYFEAGNAFLKRDLLEEAIGQYREALSISRDSRYRMALALALAQAGHWNDASIYLREALRSEPNSGPANLGMARVEARQGLLDKALPFYHHAIYGDWPNDARQNRIQVRLELIDALGKAQRRREAQLELGALLPSAMNDVILKRQVAPLLLQYGLAKESAELYQELTRYDARDATAWAGYGEAEFDQANYAAAGDAFREALTLNRNDTGVEKRLETCDRILALDPTLRGLTADQRFHRSQQLVAEVLDALDPCAPPQLRDRMAAARKTLLNQHPASLSDAAENDLTLAEQLWSAAVQACGTAVSADAPVSRVLAHLSGR